MDMMNYSAHLNMGVSGMKILESSTQATIMVMFVTIFVLRADDPNVYMVSYL